LLTVNIMEILLPKLLVQTFDVSGTFFLFFGMVLDFIVYHRYDFSIGFLICMASVYYMHTM